MKIWAHTLVMNEDRYVWFAVMSVIEWVDKILLWDTGSDDSTVEIINEIQKKYPSKVDFKEIGKVNINEFTQARQRMLEESNCDWIILVDGDEVWWDDSIKELAATINSKGEQLETIVNKYCSVVGDIYHYQEEVAGKYEIDGIRGHLTIRAMNKNIPGLNVAKPHGQQGFFDGAGKLIQERSASKRIFIKTPAYMHFTHMRRSSHVESNVPKRKLKLKYEIGKAFPLDFYYPEVFFKPRPTVVSSSWERMSPGYKARSFFIKPLKFLKRFLPSESGY